MFVLFSAVLYRRHVVVNVLRDSVCIEASQWDSPPELEKHWCVVIQSMHNVFGKYSDPFTFFKFCYAASFPPSSFPLVHSSIYTENPIITRWKQNSMQHSTNLGFFIVEWPDRSFSSVKDTWKQHSKTLRFGCPSRSFSHLHTGPLALSQSDRFLVTSLTKSLVSL